MIGRKKSYKNANCSKDLTDNNNSMFLPGIRSAIFLPLFAAFSMLMIAAPLHSGPLIQITKIDASLFPALKIHITLDQAFVRSGETLDKEQLQITEKGSRHSARLLIHNVLPLDPGKIPLNLVVIMDATRSLPRKSFRQAIKLLRNGLKNLPQSDRTILFSIRKKSHLDAGLSRDRSKLLQALTRVKRNGKQTRLFDSMADAMEAAHKIASFEQNNIASSSASTGRTAVLVFSDGRDEGSYLNQEDIASWNLRHLKRRLPIFIIHYGNRAQTQKLERMSRLSRGRLIKGLPNQKQFQTLLKEMRKVQGIPYLIHAKSQLAAKGRVIPGETIRLSLDWRSSFADDRASARYNINWKNSLSLIRFSQSFWIVMILALLVLLLLGFGLSRIFKKEERLKREDEVAIISSEIPDDEFIDEDEDTVLAVPADMGAQIDQSSGELTTISIGSENTPSEVDVRKRPYPLDNALYQSLRYALEGAMNYERAKLILFGSSGKPMREYELFLKSITIGRDRPADIVLPNIELSRIHMKLRNFDGRYVIYDLSSGTGVYLNRNKLLRPRSLRNGDEIRIGHARMVFHGEITRR